MSDYFAAGLDAEAEAQWGINAVDAAKEVQTSELSHSRLLQHVLLLGCLCKPLNCRSRRPGPRSTLVRIKTMSTARKLLSFRELWCAHQAGVGHIVFSTLEDVRKHIPEGALPALPSKRGHVVPHFESKDAVLVGAWSQCLMGERECCLVSCCFWYVFMPISERALRGCSYGTVPCPGTQGEHT